MIAFLEIALFVLQIFFGIFMFLITLTITTMFFPELVALNFGFIYVAVPMIEHNIKYSIAPIIAIIAVILFAKVSFSLLGLFYIWLEAKSKIISKIVNGFMAIVSSLSCIHILNIFLEFFNTKIKIAGFLILFSKSEIANTLLSIIFYIIATMFFYLGRKTNFMFSLNKNTKIIGKAIKKYKLEIAERNTSEVLNSEKYDYFRD